VDEREDEQPGTQPEPEQQPAEPEDAPADAPRPSALEAWAPGPPVSEPDDVGEVSAVEGHEPPDVAPAESESVPSAEAEPQASSAEAEAEEASVLPPQQVRAVLESLIFASPQPITAREIGRVLQGVPREEWERQLEALRSDYGRDERGLQVIEVAGGYQITTRPEYHDWVRELLDPRTPTRLSIQALETLAVIAYKQPVTLPEIIDLRGVKSGGVVKTLLEKRLIRITGRKEVVGRPMLYGTTKQFLLHFGLKSLDELPKIEEFAEVLGEEVDVAGLKRAIESPLPVQVTLSDPDGEQMPLFEEGAAPPGQTAEPGAPDSEATEGDETTGTGQADADGAAVEEPEAPLDAEAADTNDDDTPAGEDPREG
jgi:segregation and condensation protein B